MRKVVTVIVLLIIIMNIMIGLFNEGEDVDGHYTEELTDCEEYTLKDTLNSSVIHERSWEEFSASSMYCAVYSVGDGDALGAEQFRNGVYIDEYVSDVEAWRDLYHNLYLNSKDHLTGIQDSLLRVAGAMSQVDRDEFARLIVAFVQDIPYQYVLPNGCEDKVGACNPNVTFGIYSPVEFMYHLKGDCDTRTVLLYTLLKNFGYAPLIINSVEYRHSMLALDLPSAGDDFLYKGRRYAYWETTNVGWLPGMLPPEMNNKAYWTVALDYEYKDQPARFN